MSARLEYSLPITVKNLARTAVSLPLFGFGFCVTWSFIFDYENSTKTHCEVENFAPSISAAIGSFLPQKYVWQVAIALHIVPRFLFLWMYKQFYKSRISVITPRIYWLIQVTICFNLLELVSLLGLTLVSSQEDFDTHKACFVTFGISGLIYFVLTCILWSYCGVALETNEEIHSFKVKKSMLKLYFGFGILMSYLYYRHNEYCEDYVYSLFCLCEYAIVIANMIFHYTAKHDFAHINIVIPSRILSAKGYLPVHNT